MSTADDREGFNTVAPAERERRALDWACHGLEKGSDPYDVMSAAATGDIDTLARLLKRSDIYPDFTNGQGVTPLMVAAECRQASALALLCVQPLVNLDRQDPEGWTALHFAAEANAPTCVRLLLKHRASFEVETPGGALAIDFAGPEAREALLENRDLVRFLNRRRPRQPKPAAPAPKF